MKKWTVLTRDNYFQGDIWARNKTAARNEAIRRFGKQSYKIYVASEQSGPGYSIPAGRSKNPSKLQRALMTQKKRTERRVADALAKYLKVQNPGQKITSAKIQRLKGGVIKITPLQNNPTKRTVSFADVRDGHGWALRYSGSDSPYGNYTGLPMNSKDEALMLAKLEREEAKKRFGTLKNYRIRVVKV